MTASDATSDATESTEVERHEYDVLVIGAGGAGLRAAIAAREAGMRVAVICKSLFGKAHTVMAEGGIAASMGNVNSNDNWQVHFRDTMRGGKFLNSWRMAELHAKEAPERVWELETYGALFDRTQDGKISQRNFGGHEYPRLAHVGDRTGLELIRTLQQKIVSLQQDDEQGATATPRASCRSSPSAPSPTCSAPPTGEIAGAFGYWRESGRFILFDAPAVVLATGGIGKSFKVTSNSWEYTGDGHALALRAGSTLVNMEFVQFHPTGMVWPPSVKGILVTESVRGDGGVLSNSEGKRFMFDYVPDVFKAQYADTEEEGDRWYTDPDNNKRPPELLPRDEVARAINSEVKAGRGSPHGGVFLDISSRRPAEEIMKRLPVDAPPVQGAGRRRHHHGADGGRPDLPLRDGRRRGRPRHRRGHAVPGLFAAGEVLRRHARLEPARRQLAVRPAGVRPARRSRRRGLRRRPRGVPARRRPGRSSTRRPRRRCGPFELEGGENPYTLHQELQQTMNDLVGIIRKEAEMAEALDQLDELKERAQHVSVEGGRQFNPAGTSRSTCGTCCWSASASPRRRWSAGEPRRPHPRRLPGDGPDLAAEAARLLGRPATGRSRSRSSRRRRCAPTCSRCSRRTSCRSTSPPRNSRRSAQ